MTNHKSDSNSLHKWSRTTCAGRVFHTWSRLPDVWRVRMACVIIMALYDYDAAGNCCDTVVAALLYNQNGNTFSDNESAAIPRACCRCRLNLARKGTLIWACCLVRMMFSGQRNYGQNWLLYTSQWRRARVLFRPDSC